MPSHSSAYSKGVDEKKLKSLEVANRKNAKIDDFMEMFMEAATRIADSIDLDTFVEAVPQPERSSGLKLFKLLPRNAEW